MAREPFLINPYHMGDGGVSSVHSEYKRKKKRARRSSNPFGEEVMVVYNPARRRRRKVMAGVRRRRRRPTQLELFPRRRRRRRAARATVRRRRRRRAYSYEEAPRRRRRRRATRARRVVRRRRRRAVSSAPRRRRRRVVRAKRRGGRRRSRRRGIMGFMDGLGINRRRRHYRRNPIAVNRRRRVRFNAPALTGGLALDWKRPMSMIMPLGIGAGAFLVTEKVPQWAGLTSDLPRFGVKAATAIGGSFLIGKFLGRKAGSIFLIGSSINLAVDLMRRYVLKGPLATLGAFPYQDYSVAGYDGGLGGAVISDVAEPQYGAYPEDMYGASGISPY